MIRIAYGKFNDLVLQAAFARRQEVVIWDFEWVSFIEIRAVYIQNTSSQDSLHVSVAQQKANYDHVIEQHPSGILVVNHEVYGTLTPMNFWTLT